MIVVHRLTAPLTAERCFLAAFLTTRRRRVTRSVLQGLQFNRHELDCFDEIQMECVIDRVCCYLLLHIVQKVLSSSLKSTKGEGSDGGVAEGPHQSEKLIITYFALVQRQDGWLDTSLLHVGCGVRHNTGREVRESLAARWRS